MKLKYLITFLISLFVGCKKEYSIEGLPKEENLYVVKSKGPFKMLQGGETPDVMMIQKKDSTEKYTLCSVIPGHWDKYKIGDYFVFKKSEYRIQEYNYYYGYPDATGFKEQIPVFWIDYGTIEDPTLFFVNFDTVLIKSALQKDSLFRPR